MGVWRYNYFVLLHSTPLDYFPRQWYGSKSVNQSPLMLRLFSTRNPPTFTRVCEREGATLLRFPSWMGRVHRLSKQLTAGARYTRWSRTLSLLRSLHALASRIFMNWFSEVTTRHLGSFIYLLLLILFSNFRYRIV